MSPETLPLAYANSLIFELEKAFYDERGKGARFRTTLVGQQYFQEKCAPCLLTDTLEDMVEAVKNALLTDRLAEDLTCNADGRLLRVHIEGCAHRTIDVRMLAHGVQPFTCIPANLLVMALESRLNRPVELAEIKLEGCGCDLLLVVFEKRPELVAGRGAGAE